MAEIGAENKISGVFGGVELNGNGGNPVENANGGIGIEGIEAGTIRN